MRKLSAVAIVDEYNENMGKMCLLGHYEVEVCVHVRNTQSGSYSKGLKFHARRIGYLKRKEAANGTYAPTVYSFDHGATWHKTVDQARKAVGRKLITLRLDTHKEFAYDAIQAINRRFGM